MPPLETTTEDTRRTEVDLSELKKQVELEKEAELESKDPVKSNIISYGDGTSSEDDGGNEGYNDLEGLD